MYMRPMATTVASPLDYEVAVVTTMLTEMTYGV